MANTWDFADPGLSGEWQFESENTFFKDNTSIDHLTFFNYPVSYYVTVHGDIYEGAVTLNVTGEVSKSVGAKIYKTQLESKVFRTFTGDIIVESVREIVDG